MTFYQVPVDIVSQILNFGVAGADRYSGGRAETGGQPRCSPRTLLNRAEVRPGSGGSENPATVQLSETAY